MGFWLGIDSSFLTAQCTPFPTGHNIDEALDGTDYWECPHTHPHNFVLDLGFNYFVQKVRGRSNRLLDPVTVIIDGSLNGVDWFLLKTGITDWRNTATWITHNTNEEVCRYLRVTIPDTEDIRLFLEFGGVPPFTIFDAYVSFAPGMIGASSDGGGWCMLSICHDGNINKTNLLFLYNGTYYTYTQATTNDNEEGTPLIDFWFFGWDYTNQAYEATNTINGWCGYWNYHYFDVAVYYPVETGNGNIVLIKGRQMS